MRLFCEFFKKKEKKPEPRWVADFLVEGVKRFVDLLTRGLLG